MKHPHSETGQALSRLMLLMPILLVLLLGLHDLSRLYCSYMAVLDAARDGATYASTHPDDVAGIVAHAQAGAEGFVEIDESQVTVHSPPGLIRSVVVTIDYEFSFMTPLANTLLPSGPLVLSGAVMEKVQPAAISRGG